MFDPCIAHQIQASQVNDLGGFFFCLLVIKNQRLCRFECIGCVFFEESGQLSFMIRFSHTLSGDNP